MKGSTFKRCKCRGDDGRELGAKCPELRRKNGSWNPSHGSWYGKAELPAAPDGKRVDLRVGGFRTEAELANFFEDALRLISIPDSGPDGHTARMEIRQLILDARRNRGPMPLFDEIRRKYQAGQAFRPETFGEFWARWIARRRRTGDIRKSTLIAYESHHRIHLHVLDDVRMDRLRVTHLDALFAGIDDKNAELLAAKASEDPAVRAAVRGQRVTGPATKQRIRATLRSALSDAQREGLVSENVAKLVKLEAAKRPKGLVWTMERVTAWTAEYERALEQAREEAGGKTVNALKVWAAMPRPSKVMVWTPAQLGVFLDHAARHRLYGLFHLVGFRGLRRGEACGLRWEDTDLDAGQVIVRTQLVQVGWDVEEGDPKTDSSEAPIALDQATVKVLRAHRGRQNAERLAWGEAWQETGRVFTREDGSELHPAWVSEQFERLAFEAGLPPIRMHDLRHGAATMGLSAGVDMATVQAMLRHSSITITSDTYTSIMPEVAREAAEAIAALVPRRAVVGEASETTGLPSVSPGGVPGPTDFRARRNPLVNRGLKSRAPGTRTQNLRIKSPQL
ncbi:site-specific integrase [Streptosporangium pseudovulgare]|uniref:Site-specific integrase n=1 Tax=Streptosporangium pseudovulgare TaxID=35765 RepID=A0ABQ2RFA7_9ACTN|nr:site-specific integrase [Streptosporangium pseudovulgare]